MELLSPVDTHQRFSREHCNYGVTTKPFVAMDHPWTTRGHGKPGQGKQTHTHTHKSCQPPSPQHTHNHIRTHHFTNKTATGPSWASPEQLGMTQPCPRQRATARPPLQAAPRTACPAGLAGGPAAQPIGTLETELRGGLRKAHTEHHKKVHAVSSNDRDNMGGGGQPQHSPACGPLPPLPAPP